MTATIREWARAQGMEVGDRGLIPREIVEQYKAAHGIGAHPDRDPHSDPLLRFLTLEAWLELRGELMEIIDGEMRSEQAAERILLAGWMRPEVES